jgi:hypothetical protein
MKCVTTEEGLDILREIHEGVCGNHAASKSLVGKAYRAGYLINHFFRVNCPEKRGFSNFEFNLCQLHHLGLYFLNKEHFCHDFLILFYKI